MDEAGRQPPRPEPLDADPSARLDEVFGLLDDLAEVTWLSEGLFGAIEQVTGLRIGEVQVLRTIAHDTVDVADVGRRTGQPDDAAAATVGGLVARGLVHSTRGAEPSRTLRLTQSGAALLEQTQGVQVRFLDLLVQETGTEGVHAFRTALRGIAEVLRAVGDRTGPPQAQATDNDQDASA